MKRYLFVCGMLAFLFVCLACINSQQRISRFPVPGFEGDLWLGWNHDQRDAFVRGFLVGHREGWKGACSATDAAKPATPPGDTLRTCLGSERLFHHEVSYYVNSSTDFYERYPGDLDVPLATLIENLEDNRPEQIHDWVNRPKR